MVELYTQKQTAMAEGKSVSVSFRVSPNFKQLLEAAAARERRSQTNMLETLLFAYCKAHDIETAHPKTSTELPVEGPAT